MKEDVIGRRYAKALIAIGQEQGKWQEIGQGLGAFVALFEENEILRKVLCNPIHDRKKRKDILRDVLGKVELGTICSNFLQLLVDKERIRYLPAIYSAYREYGRFGSFIRHTIPAGESLSLRYRLYVVDGAMSSREEMDGRYTAFVNPPKVEVLQ